MTHAELRAAHRGGGLEPSACPGELEPSAAIVVDPVDGHLVALHRCPLCRHAIPVDVTDGRVRNDYPEDAPDDPEPPP